MTRKHLLELKLQFAYLRLYLGVREALSQYPIEDLDGAFKNTCLVVFGTGVRLILDVSINQTCLLILRLQAEQAQTRLKLFASLLKNFLLKCQPEWTKQWLVSILRFSLLEWQGKHRRMGWMR